MNLIIPLLVVAGMVCLSAAAGLTVREIKLRDSLIITQDSTVAFQDREMVRLQQELDHKAGELRTMAVYVKHLASKAMEAQRAEEQAREVGEAPMEDTAPVDQLPGPAFGYVE